MSATEAPAAHQQSGPRTRTDDRVAVNVSDRVLKPVHDVFTAIVDPAKLSRFLVTSAGGPLEEGATVDWVLAEQHRINPRAGRSKEDHVNVG
jgi:hypothetical protein